MSTYILSILLCKLYIFVIKLLQTDLDTCMGAWTRCSAPALPVVVDSVKVARMYAKNRESS